MLHFATHTHDVPAFSSPALSSPAFSASPTKHAAGGVRDVSYPTFDVQLDDSYTGRGTVERRGRGLGVRRCDRVAAEQKFNTDLATMPNSRFESVY